MDTREKIAAIRELLRYYSKIKEGGVTSHEPICNALKKMTAHEIEDFQELHAFIRMRGIQKFGAHYGDFLLWDIDNFGLINRIQFLNKFSYYYLTLNSSPLEYGQKSNCLRFIELRLSYHCPFICNLLESFIVNRTDNIDRIIPKGEKKIKYLYMLFKFPELMISILREGCSLYDDYFFSTPVWDNNPEGLKKRFELIQTVKSILAKTK